MKTFMNILAMALVLSAFFAGTTAGESQVKVVEQQIMNTGDVQDLNFTKLEINPRYANFRLQPGESRDVKVTIKNMEDKTISVKPFVVIQPNGEYIMDKNWITITPASKDIPAGASEKFVISTVIPADASIGYYNPMILFTDEAYPSSFPSPFPNYVHAMSLSIDVWKTPAIVLTNQYINDQVEGGKEVDYKVKLKNTGTEPVPIDPMIIKDDMYYGPYGSPLVLTKDEVTISGPKEIAPGSIGELNVHIKVPAGPGTYHGVIDLGIQDPSAMRDPYMYRVQIDIGVWTQPIEAYVKTFTANEASPLTIEVSSGMGGYYYPPKTSQTKKDPTFSVTLTGSDNKEISLKKIKSVIKGSASLGGMYSPPWESEGSNIYQEMSVQYSETYSGEVQAGTHKLSILPQNTQQFDYTITMGNN